jgi:hypothetical protein
MNISVGAQSRRPEDQWVSNVIASFSEWEQARVLIFLARCEMLAIHRR